MVHDKESTITDREYGALEQELKEVRHDHRNLRQVIEMSGISHITKEDIVDVRNRLSKYETQNSFKYIKELETKVQELDSEFHAFKTKLYTMASIGAVIVSALVWFIEISLKI